MLASWEEVDVRSLSYPTPSFVNIARTTAFTTIVPSVQKYISQVAILILSILNAGVQGKERKEDETFLTIWVRSSAVSFIV